MGDDGRGHATTNPDDILKAECSCRSVPIANAEDIRATRWPSWWSLERRAQRGKLGAFAPPLALRQEIPKRSVGEGIAISSALMRIDGFIDGDAFRRQIDDYNPRFSRHKAGAWHQRPLIPGDPERRGGTIAA